MAAEMRALAHYSEEYTFRVWMACVEDMHRLQLGYRAYCDYMVAQLHSLENEGFDFLNPYGGKAQIDCLTHGDFYGFLGKSDRRPHGPQRNLSPNKMAVIDLFFKSMYPSIAAFFLTIFDCESFYLSNKMFYTNGAEEDAPKRTSLRMSEDVSVTFDYAHEKARRVFATDPKSYRNLVRQQYEIGEGKLSAEAVSIKIIELIFSEDRWSSGMARLVEISPKSSLFLKSSSVRTYFEKMEDDLQKAGSDVQDSPTEIFEGVFYSHAEWAMNFSGSVEGFFALRDRVTREPLVDTCRFSTSIVKRGVMSTKTTIHAFGGELREIQEGDRYFLEPTPKVAQTNLKDLLFSPEFYKVVDQFTGSLRFSNVD